jgi:hypothetical protein
MVNAAEAPLRGRNTHILRREPVQRHKLFCREGLESADYGRSGQSSLEQ